MAEFHITNSKVEQVNDTGDNYKVTGNRGAVAVTQRNGQTVQVTGDGNKLQVGGAERKRLGRPLEKGCGVGQALVRRSDGVTGLPHEKWTRS
jgi:hypothetical protein